MQNQERKQKALELLTEMGLKNLEYLGQGNEGIVFHDNTHVYKVLVPYYKGKNKLETYRRLSYFLDIKNAPTIYELESVSEYKDFIIEKYKYEPSEPCIVLSEKNAIDFLTDCWQKKIIIQDCKNKNFIKINDLAKLVDLDACGYTDNLFYNMCIRMYLYANHYPSTEKSIFLKTQRSAINNFDLPVLEGAREFVNKVFANIIYQESLPEISKFKIPEGFSGELFTCDALPNLDKLFFYKIKQGKFIEDVAISDLVLNDKLYFEPQKIGLIYRELIPLKDKVTLLIKTCPQDTPTIEANIKHIIRQLSSPNPFYEVVVSIDTKEAQFLREYNSTGNLARLIEIVQKLVDDKVIDRYIVFDAEKTEEINERWFGIRSNQAHTTKNIPISSQLFAFEQCQGDYVMQCDCDVLIGRKDLTHSFLEDMLSELKQNENVLFVGFNIYNRESKPYFGFENGGFVPEVRFGLFEKERLFALRPFPNSVDNEGRLELSWYRSIELFQKQSGYCSIRGGDNRSFYIHPQNYRKTEPYAWMTILDRVEQFQIPEIQYGGFDCEGSFYDWCTPKRTEKMVVISCFRNVSIERFLRFWTSLMSQDYQDFGVILCDDNSDNGTPFLIEKLIQPYGNRVTFIRSRVTVPKIQLEYQAIHYFCENPQSIVALIDADDALVGSNVLDSVYKKYDIWGIDVSVGRVHQTYRLQPHYRYPVNFIDPRNTGGGNVWQHLKTFRKYLFDSIPLTYFKYKSVEKIKLNKNPWFEKCDDYAIMVPIIEMSKSPLQLDFVNYFYERDYNHRDANRDLKNQCIAEILGKPSLNRENVFIGRQSFRPDFERIEIDLTYDCNLKCLGCNRSCGQMPSKEQLDLQDIRNFINDSIKLGKTWKHINVLGGEPTLHPDFESIIMLLQKYVDEYSPNTTIQVVSNGIAKKSRELCEKIKAECKNVSIDYDSYKTNNKVEFFSSFNDAPVDDDNFKDADYTKACWVTSYCGIGLTSRGYYACAVCGGIDRVLDERDGVRTFSQLTEEKLKEHYNKFCRLCGNYKAYAQNAGNFIPRCEKEPFRNIVSKSWNDIYKRN